MQPWFFPVWTVLCVVGFLVFHVSRNVERKQRWHTPFAVGIGAVFLAAVLSMGDMGGFGLVAVPWVALITWMNVRMTRFCRQCGRTVYHYLGFGRPAFCPSCGAPLPDR